MSPFFFSYWHFFNPSLNVGVTFKGIDDEIFLKDFILIAVVSTLLAEFEEISCYVVSKGASPKNHVASIECIPQPLVSKKLGP